MGCNRLEILHIQFKFLGGYTIVEIVHSNESLTSHCYRTEVLVDRLITLNSNEKGDAFDKN